MRWDRKATWAAVALVACAIIGSNDRQKLASALYLIIDDDDPALDLGLQATLFILDLVDRHLASHRLLDAVLTQDHAEGWLFADTVANDRRANGQGGRDDGDVDWVPRTACRSQLKHLDSR